MKRLIGPRCRVFIVTLALVSASACSSDESKTSPTTTAVPVPVTVAPTTSPPATVPAEPEPGSPPPVDQTTAMDVFDSTKFLYEGPDAKQKGVTPGVIKRTTVAVLRGRVSDKSGEAVTGANVTVVGHTEYGTVSTDSDGSYSIAMNGGGLVTLNIEKAGFLSSQRQVDAPWVDYASAPDVVLLKPDPKTTVIDLTDTSKPFHVAQGSKTVDDSGTRRATLLIPSGTNVRLMQPDGSTVPSTKLTLRFTEYTTGENGPEAMPGTLPPTSAYTYAVEINADEAKATVHGKSVLFDRPVYLYTDNFLSFPVGADAPSGYYDETDARWVSSVSGRVLKVTGIANGVAEVDVTGDNLADSGDALAVIGLSDGELRTMASFTQPGNSLWRTPLDHLSKWDSNWGVSPPDDAVAPDQPPLDEPEPVSDPCEQSGSIIECENQVLGERVPIVGTGYSLNYRSNRVPGGNPAALLIPLSGATIPASLAGIKLDIDVAGVHHTSEYDAKPNLSESFTWDRRDGFDRLVNGPQPATIRVSYKYRPTYTATSRFGYSGAGAVGAAGVLFEGTPARDFLTLSRVWTVQLGFWDAAGEGLGSWTISEHHTYDPRSRTLHLGDGSNIRTDASVTGAVTQVVGSPRGRLDPADGVPGPDADIGTPDSIALAPDGSLYYNHGHAVIRALRPDGKVYHVAGSYRTGYTGDGGRATESTIYLSGGAGKMAVDSEGRLLFVQVSDLGTVIRRIGQDGIITTIAGSRKSCTQDCKLERPISDSALPVTYAVALRQDGSMVAQADGYLYGIGPGSDLVGLASTDRCTTAPCAFNETAATRVASLPVSYTQMAVGPDGTIYFVQNDHLLRSITPDGQIHIVAGRQDRVGRGIQCLYSTADTCGDGGPAKAAGLSQPKAVVVGRDGTIFVADQYGSRVRKISTDGAINLLLGNGQDDRVAGLAPAATGMFVNSMALDPTGILYFSAINVRGLFRIEPAFPGVTDGDLQVPAADGSELYVFNSEGRHLRTLHGLTGAIVRQFGYDSSGRLTQVTEMTGGDPNVTTIQHAQRDGLATEIVAPFGHRTVLNMEPATGYVAAISNPAKETTLIATSNTGLVQSLTKPTGATTMFSYDSATGRLERESNPAGGGYILSRTGDARDYTVSVTTGEGRTTTYQVQTLPDGSSRRTVTAPGGAKSLTVRRSDGSIDSTTADGTKSYSTIGPDPRWGMKAPIVVSRTVTLPSGLTRTILTSSAREPADGPPFSFVTLSERAIVNGKPWNIVYSQAEQRATTTSPMGVVSSTTIDSTGRVTAVKAPGAVMLTIAYDRRGRPKTLTQANRTRDFRYDEDLGWLKEVTDSGGLSIKYQHDQAGRLTGLIRPGGTPEIYTYDGAGNANSIQVGDQSPSETSFDNVGLPTTHSEQGVSHATFEFNLDRQMTKINNAGGSSVTFGYGSTGQLSEIASAGTQYRYGYDAVGRLSTARSPDELNTQLTYDGALVTQISTADPALVGKENATAWRFNDNFDIASVQVGDTVVQTTYDDDGRPTSIGPVALRRSVETGQMVALAHRNLIEDFDYDSLGNVRSIEVKAASHSIFDREVLRDGAGRIASTRRSTASGTTETKYEYDSDGRLATVITNGSATEHYTYTQSGNRSTSTIRGRSTTQAYDSIGRLIKSGDTSYSYSGDGALESTTNPSGTTKLEYDSQGNLKSLVGPDGNQITYDTDALGRRVNIKLNGVTKQTFTYGLGTRPLSMHDVDSQADTLFVYAPDGTTPLYMHRGTKSYQFITDDVGSILMVVDVDSGTVVQEITYESFGIRTQDTNPGFQPLGFAGGIQDPLTGLIRFGRRDYDPMTGRWTAPDPIGVSGGSPNLYVYCSNNPVGCYDPTGEIVLVDDAAVIVVVAAALLAVLLWNSLNTPRYTRTSTWSSTPSETEAQTCPVPSADDLRDKTPDEIRELADRNGYKPDKWDSDNKPRRWKDPASGEERLRLDEGHKEKDGTPYRDPRAAAPHVHGYDQNGKVTDPLTPDSNPHFPTR